MSSIIETIIDNIKAWTPVFDSDVSVGTLDIDEMPITLDVSDCPVRMFSVVDPKVNAEFAHIALGSTAGIDWYILDRLYILPAKMDEGLKGNNAKIIKYTASYFEQARINRGVVTTATVKGVSVAPPYVRNWPDYEGGVPYYVVDCVVHIFEVIT